MVLNALSLTETIHHSASCLRLLCNLLHLAATLVQPLAALPPCSSFCTLLQPRAGSQPVLQRVGNPNGLSAACRNLLYEVALCIAIFLPPSCTLFQNILYYTPKEVYGITPACVASQMWLPKVDL
jgi:hypothetical protein